MSSSPLLAASCNTVVQCSASSFCKAYGPTAEQSSESNRATLGKSGHNKRKAGMNEERKQCI